MTLAAGPRIGPYEIVSSLGWGLVVAGGHVEALPVIRGAISPDDSRGDRTAVTDTYHAVLVEKWVPGTFALGLRTIVAFTRAPSVAGGGPALRRRSPAASGGGDVTRAVAALT